MTYLAIDTIIQTTFRAHIRRIFPRHFKIRSGYRNGSVSRGPKTLLQTRITNPPG